MPDDDDAAETTLDEIFGGRLRLRQPRHGHRAGSDAVLLAAAAPAGFCGRAVDLGAGVGTAGLILATRCPGASVDLVENEPAAAACARLNIRDNGQANRARIWEADLFDAAAMGPLAVCADLVLTNPPYLDPARVRLPPDARRRTAHAMPKGALAGWIAAAAACLKPNGVMIVIHRADAVPDLVAACRPHLGALTLLPLLPEAQRPARRILLRGKKGSGAPFVLAPPLVLHEAGVFTPAVAAIHRGDGSIIWPGAQ